LNRSTWCDIVALLPPTTAECMSVPIWRLRRWLTDESDNTDQGDQLGTRTQTAGTEDLKKAKGKQKKPLDQSRAGVLWRGIRDSQRIRSLDDLRPGDTLVLPANAGGWNELGHAPNAALETVDVAEGAFLKARDRAVL